MKTALGVLETFKNFERERHIELKICWSYEMRGNTLFSCQNQYKFKNISSGEIA
jgi:hypothetical protein